jgi:ribosomal protein S18 acetylase RimI-like enzyme
MLNLVDRLSNTANAESVNQIQDEPGTRLFAIRQAGDGDCQAIKVFLAGLSPRTRYLRFFTGAPGVTAAMLRLLAGGGPGTDVVVATAAGAIIGHAMAVETAGRHGTRVTDIGVAVADAWQGRGVGSALTRALTDTARARGSGMLTMDVLAENQQVLAMIAHRWPDARYESSGGCVTVHAPLRPARWLPSPAPSAAVAARG